MPGVRRNRTAPCSLASECSVINAIRWPIRTATARASTPKTHADERCPARMKTFVAIKGFEMRTFLWMCLGFAVTGWAFWVVTTKPTIPPNPLSILMLALVFGISPIGSFWMLYMVIRHEKRTMPYALLAFIPYFFVGYYFDRVRSRSKQQGN
jgi:hypothetical protein